MQIIPTILCGGAGSRLWPVSRALHPKPFIRLLDGQSLLQKALLRGLAIPGVTDVLTVTNADLLFKIQQDYAEVTQHRCQTHFILEPFGRNTNAAIATAARYVSQEYGPDAVMLILAADHLIELEEAFLDAVSRAVALAVTGKLVVFGIQPDRPETGYGYIEVDPLAALTTATDELAPLGFSVARFVEKPQLAVAQTYLDSGNHLWNAGLFCFTAGRVLEQMAQVCPDSLTAADACFKASAWGEITDGRRLTLDKTTFAQIPDVSFDYAVMEPAKNVAVVACDIGWSDVGSWNVLGDLTQADAQGNRISGQACLHEVSNCTISSDSRMVGAVGVDNLLIIDTPDALLVADQSRAQDVKHLYSQLKAQDHEAHKLHRTVHRPWGNYTVLEEGSSFKIKRIVVKPQASLSLQMHHHRSEHWIVVSGMAEVVCGEQTFLISTNQSTYIPAGFKHRLKNPGILELVMIEVQSGLYLGEDDIVRFEDIYGRVETPA